MDGNPTKYFWAEPDGGADLRLSLSLDCFWEAPGYDSGITVRLSQEGGLKIISRCRANEKQCKKVSMVFQRIG